ncbi:hypothetical protein ACOT81_43595 [Streptomyces sp. WI04-05B]|uniref:hypothetical protein n=1 Tax=Streptomyces TaxID=1883 RepID=UPI0029BF168E|nr:MULTISPECIES: hypothetical protein [unclassified Streptomyces]MDX2543298.1 hypothetical protein [Streptomyces sp. WI04-05B]MDX2586700.1 hypothetical protein [Streptomyces sp. WI04-05A]MDX3748406.1 hypothetical protein [Streptomyces sp. AK08-02]
MSPPSHNHDLEYQQIALGTVETPYQVSTDAGEATVTGACPRCHGHTSTTIPKGVAGTKGLFSGLKAKPPSQAEVSALTATETFFCECGFAHAGQPEILYFVGCGAQWELKPGTGSRSTP